MAPQRLRVAGTRAVEAHAKIRRMAEQIDQGLDEATPPSGVVSAFLSEEDSMVTSVAEVIARSKTASTPPPLPAIGRVKTKLGPASPVTKKSGSQAALSNNGSGSYSIVNKK